MIMGTVSHYIQQNREYYVSTPKTRVQALYLSASAYDIDAILHACCADNQMSINKAKAADRKRNHKNPPHPGEMVRSVAIGTLVKGNSELFPIAVCPNISNSSKIEGL